MARSLNFTNVIEPLTQDECKLWIEALRSGEYKQGTAKLKAENHNGVCTYCCLGVLREVLRKIGKWPKVDECSIGFLQYYDQEDNAIQIKLHHSNQAILAELNDEDNKSFAQIADYIEKRILPRLSSNA